ncbi:hypothetical protein J6590_018702 [Homalodisca vitripennis]|nr:hypothetical protein J6590_018702 [Homalodisca vitripennis]
MAIWGGGSCGAQGGPLVATRRDVYVLSFDITVFATLSVHVTDTVSTAVTMETVSAHLHKDFKRGTIKKEMRKYSTLWHRYKKTRRLYECERGEVVADMTRSCSVVQTPVLQELVLTESQDNRQHQVVGQRNQSQIVKNRWNRLFFDVLKKSSELLGATNYSNLEENSPITFEVGLPYYSSPPAVPVMTWLWEPNLLRKPPTMREGYGDDWASILNRPDQRIMAYVRQQMHNAHKSDRQRETRGVEFAVRQWKDLHDNDVEWCITLGRVATSALSVLTHVFICDCDTPLGLGLDCLKIPE